VPVVHTCNPRYSGDRDQEDSGSKPAWQIVRETLSQKYPTQKWAGGVAQAVQHLPSKCEALGSNPSIGKINK
jgi:hypothetical protein